MLTGAAVDTKTRRCDTIRYHKPRLKSCRQTLYRGVLALLPSCAGGQPFDGTSIVKWPRRHGKEECQDGTS